MSTKITLDNPTGEGQLAVDLGIWVENGESIQVDDPKIAVAMLKNPIWKGKAPKIAEDTTDAEEAEVNAADEAEGDSK